MKTRGHRIAMALRAAYLAMHRQTDARLSGRGATADQFVVLSALAEAEALSQSELVSRTSSDPSTLRAMLVRLEAKGLVARRPHPTDRRARGVRLTARGRRLLADLYAESEALRQRLVEPLTPAEIATLLRCLATIAETFERPATRRSTASPTG